MQKRAFLGWPWMWAAAAWTLFVWVGRIRNMVNDDDMSSGETVGVALLSASFIILTLGVVAMWLAGSRLTRSASMVALAWTAAVWAVRVFDIAFLSDRSIGFIVVHSVLGVVSVGLWALALFTYSHDVST